MNELERVNEIEKEIAKLRQEHRKAITEYLKSIGFEIGTVFKKHDCFGNVFECKICESKDGNFIYKLNKEYSNIGTFNYEKLKEIILESEV